MGLGQRVHHAGTCKPCFTKVNPYSNSFTPCFNKRRVHFKKKTNLGTDRMSARGDRMSGEGDTM